MHSRKRKNKIIIASLLAVVLIMGIGYAAFSSKLNINGTGSVSGNWDIKITNMKSIPTGGAYNIKDPIWEDLTASFFVGLTSPGDSMVYEIEVTNSGNINAKLEDLKVNMGNNKAITYDINGLDIGDTLEANSTITFNLIISFDSNITSMPDDVTSNIELKLDYSQDSNSSNSENSDIDYGTLTKPTITYMHKIIKVTPINDTTYPWSETNGFWKTTTQGKNSTTTNLSFSFTLTEKQTLSFNWSVSSESVSYDYVYYTITKDGTALSGTGTSTKIGGTGYGTTEDGLTYNTVSKELEAGTYVLKFTYIKDGSTASGTDTAYVKNLQLNGFPIDKSEYWKINIDYHYDCSSYICTYNYNDGEIITVKENPVVTVDSEGKMTATVTSGSDKGITVAYIDTTVPTLKGVTLTKATGIYKVTVNAEDKVSGIQKYEFRKGTTWTNKKLNNSISVIADSISDINLGIRVTDKAGNVAETIYKPVEITGIINNKGAFLNYMEVSGKMNLSKNINNIPTSVLGTINLEESE